MPRDIPRDIPQSVSDAVDAVARAGQGYGAAATRARADATVCAARMAQQKEAIRKTLVLIEAELTRRYEAGIEMGRQQAASEKSK